MIINFISLSSHGKECICLTLLAYAAAQLSQHSKKLFLLHRLRVFILKTNSPVFANFFRRNSLHTVVPVVVLRFYNCIFLKKFHSNNLLNINFSFYKSQTLCTVTWCFLGLGFHPYYVHALPDHDWIFFFVTFPLQWEIDKLFVGFNLKKKKINLLLLINLICNLLSYHHQATLTIKKLSNKMMK